MSFWQWIPFFFALVKASETTDMDRNSIKPLCTTRQAVARDAGTWRIDRDAARRLPRWPRYAVLKVRLLAKIYGVVMTGL